MMIIELKMPYTKQEFLDAGPVQQAEMVRELCKNICRKADPDPVTWEELANQLKEKGPENMVKCPHEIRTIATMLVYEGIIHTLQESMDDLCEEMERVKAQSPTYVMGPGVTE